MGKSKATQRLFDSLGEPVDTLGSNEVIAKVIKARGNNLYEVEITRTDSSKLASLVRQDKLTTELYKTLVLMPPKFRNTIFVKRGGFVVIQWYTGDGVDPESKVKGEISNIVTNKKDWQKMPYWPVEFKEQEKSYDIEISDEEDGSDDLNDDSDGR
jgi:probable RNA-binding protein EIF1AD